MIETITQKFLLDFKHFKEYVMHKLQGNTSGLSVPTADPGDGVTIWLDGDTLKVSTKAS